MDPISIATASASLVITCSKLMGYIYTIINKCQNVDSAVQVLSIEIDLLSRVLASISTSFNNPLLATAALRSQTGHEAQHWRDVRQSMDDCKSTLEDLERILESIKKESGGFLWRPKKLIRLEMKSTEIQLLKQQVNAYRQTLHLLLQLINVYISPFIDFMFTMLTALPV